MQIFVCHLAHKIGQISTKFLLIHKIESFHMKYIDYTSKNVQVPNQPPLNFTAITITIAATIFVVHPLSWSFSAWSWVNVKISYFRNLHL